MSSGSLLILFIGLLITNQKVSGRPTLGISLFSWVGQFSLEVVALQITQCQTIQSFRGNGQHFELPLKANWKPVQGCSNRGIIRLSIL